MSCRREAAIPLLPLAILEDCTGRPQTAAAVTAARGCLEESVSQWLLVTKLRTQRERLNSTMFLFYYLLVRSSYLTGSWEETTCAEPLYGLGALLAIPLTLKLAASTCPELSFGRQCVRVIKSVTQMTHHTQKSHRSVTRLLKQVALKITASSATENRRGRPAQGPEEAGLGSTVDLCPNVVLCSRFETF